MPTSPDSLSLDGELRLPVEDMNSACKPIMSEALVAQRLLTIGQGGIGLVNEHQADIPVERWGTGLAAVVAALLPHRAIVEEARAKRHRRLWQEQLLKHQSSWPDFGSVASTAFLLCADHRPSEYGLPAQLYIGHRPDALASWSDFDVLLDQLLGAVSPTKAPAYVSARQSLREALITILAETFKNTQDHGRHEANGAEVPISIRGIYARFYPIAEIAQGLGVREDFAASPADRYARSFLSQPVRGRIFRANEPGIGGLLEVSIFDSGAGMAAKWLGRGMEGVGAREQYDAVLDCFRKGKTSTGSPGRGFGLAKVLTNISAARGFMGVRTNGIHVYRQFGTQRGVGWQEREDGSPIPEERLFDWQKVLSPNPSECIPARGTVVSFLLPMGDT